MPKGIWKLGCYSTVIGEGVRVSGWDVDMEVGGASGASDLGFWFVRDVVGFFILLLFPFV